MILCTIAWWEGMGMGHLGASRSHIADSLMAGSAHLGASDSCI
jgi:hypothetical protein